MSDAMTEWVELWGRTEVRVRASDQYVYLPSVAWPRLRRVLADRHYEESVRVCMAGQSPAFDLREGRLWMPVKLAFHVVQQLDRRFAMDVSRLIGQVIRGTPADDLPPVMRMIKTAGSDVAMTRNSWKPTKSESDEIYAGWRWARRHNMLVGCRTFDVATRLIRAACPTAVLDGVLTGLRDRWHPEDAAVFVALAPAPGPRRFAYSRVAESPEGSGAGALIFFADADAVEAARARITAVIAAMQTDQREGGPNHDPEEA